MDIHKPKAVHGWREFVNEIGVIVIGVLIALAAEQAVEALHWKHEVEEQRQSLTAEFRDGVGAVASHRRQQSCIDRRLAAIGAVLTRHSRGAPLGIIGSFAYPTRAGATQGSWDIALAGQALSHMQEAERLKFSGAFGILKRWEEMTERERSIWARLSLLTGPGTPTESDWSTIKVSYAEAVDMNDQRHAFADFILQSVSRETFSYSPPQTRGTDAFNALDRQICAPFIT